MNKSRLHRARAFWAGFRHYLGLALVSVFVLFPYYWMIITAVRPANEVAVSPAKLVPGGFQLDNFVSVWQSIPLLKYMRNTVIVAVIVTLLSVFVACLCGYSISRNIWRRLHRISFVLLLTTQLIPGVLPLAALYFIFFRVGLNNTYLGLIVANLMWSLPFCSLMMKNYFDAAIPPSLEESASLDGCSKFGTFFRICLPISIPGVISTAIFSFITTWNEYMWASIILSNDDLKPVSVGIYDYLGQFGANSKMALTMTVATLVTIPVVLLFAFLQKYLISGLSAGAVKE